MHIKGQLILDAQTWGRLCTLLMGTIAASVLLIVLNRSLLHATHRQGLSSAEVLLVPINASLQAGSVQQLTLLKGQIKLLKQRLHALKERKALPVKTGGMGEHISQTAPATTKILRGDLLQTTVADNASTALVEAGRELRKDLRSAVILDGDVAPEAVQNGSYNGEVWVSQLDAPLDAAHRRLSEGASWALAPFLAHQAVSRTGYKWMLFGNASTVYFPEAALQLLEDFDADLPYIITDSLIWTNSSGAALPDDALRCLPCHFDDSDEMLRLSQGTLTASRQSVVQDAWGSGPPKGCPCSPEVLCRANPHLFKTPHDCRNPEFPSSPEHLYSLDSTSGLIVSIGLMRSISLQHMVACAQSRTEPDAKGAAILLECLWELGYAVTDPGVAAYRPCMRLFDPFQGAELYEIVNRLKWDIAFEDTCDLQCQDLVHFMVSAYIRDSDREEAAVKLKKLASKWLWWWESQKKDFVPTTLYWPFK